MTTPLLVTLIAVYLASILGIVAADSTLQPRRPRRDLRLDPADNTAQGDDLLPTDR